jgi:hypothetical protein
MGPVLWAGPDVVTPSNIGEITYTPNVHLTPGEKYFIGLDYGFFTSVDGGPVVLLGSRSDDPIPDGQAWRFKPEGWDPFNPNVDIAARIVMDSGIGGCRSPDPLFFYKNIEVGLVSPTKIRAEFNTTGTGCTLKQVAQAYGYTQFNWINVVKTAPRSLKRQCLTATPFFDPLPGRALWCLFDWGDEFDYYWNIVRRNGSAENTELDKFMGPWTIIFLDEPEWESLRDNEIIRFATSLVGMYAGNSYGIPLDTFLWETDYNGTTGGVVCHDERCQ